MILWYGFANDELTLNWCYLYTELDVDLAVIIASIGLVKDKTFVD